MPPDDARARDRDQRAAADLQRLLQRLEPLPPPVARPTLVVMAGLPGTGKSTVSRALASRIPAAIVESDAVRKTLFPQPAYRPVEHYIVFQRCYALVDHLVRRGVTVIFDATNLVERHRKVAYRIAEQHGAQLLVLLTDAPTAVVRQRLEARERQPDGNSDAGWSVYERMASSLQRIKREHIIIDTTQDCDPILDAVVRRLQSSPDTG